MRFKLEKLIGKKIYNVVDYCGKIYIVHIFGKGAVIKYDTDRKAKIYGTVDRNSKIDGVSYKSKKGCLVISLVSESGCKLKIKLYNVK